MSDSIDRQALYEQTAEWEASALHMVKKLMSSGNRDPDDLKEYTRWSAILQERTAFKHDVADAQAVDAVPVVRCKDCKHRDPEDKKCDCGHDIQWQLPRDAEWFCADGERREDG